MSGLGGGGAMVLYRAREDRYEVIDYGMRAPVEPAAGRLSAERRRGVRFVPVGAGQGRPQHPRPRRDRGARRGRRHGGSASPPRQNAVAGIAGAERRLAGEGLAVDWWTTLMIASSAADLRRYPASATAYLVDGLPPNAPWGIKTKVRLPQDRLKATMAHLAAQGPRDFYEGDLARSLAADVQDAGGALSVEDLSPFKAYLREPLAIPYRGGKVFATPELTAGPTLARTLHLLQQNLQPRRAGRMRQPTPPMPKRCNRPIASASRTWATPTAGARSAPKRWRRPAPRISRRSTATATWRR